MPLPEKSAPATVAVYSYVSAGFRMELAMKCIESPDRSIVSSEWETSIVGS